MEYEEAVDTLVGWHAKEHTDANLLIFSYDDPEQLTVRLIEISQRFGPTGQAWPVGFGPTASLPKASQVILLNPEEWQQVQGKSMPLPDDWANTTPRQVWPRVGSGR